MQRRKAGAHVSLVHGLWSLVFAVAVCACFITIPSRAQAKPLEGFHEGPYLQLTVGARDASFDTNVADSAPLANEIEPSFGFIFGWNFTDPFAFELSGQYSAAKTTSVHEHLMNVRVGTKWTFVNHTLTHFQSLRLLPFLTGAGLLQMNILPGASGTTDGRALQWGTGVSLGGGLASLFLHDHVYLHIAGIADVVHRWNVNQTVGLSAVEVYRGGWGIDWSALTGIGVHF